MKWTTEMHGKIYQWIILSKSNSDSNEIKESNSVAIANHSPTTVETNRIKTFYVIMMIKK